MNNKKGISLIVLIVTIIVIIILAAAVILTLNQNNPIDSSRIAQLADNRTSINSAVQLYYGKYMAVTKGIHDAKHIFTAKDGTGAAIENMTALVTDPTDGTYSQIENGKNDLLGITIPTVANASWYLDVNTGLVYLVYESNTVVPDWMFTDDAKKDMDASIKEFVKVKDSTGKIVDYTPAT